MAKGRSTFKLNINSEYIIKISYPGHTSRTISLNTTVPVENLLDLWPSYSFTAKLMDGITTEGQLTKPYVRIKYSPEIYDFEHIDKYIAGEFNFDLLNASSHNHTSVFLDIMT